MRDQTKCTGILKNGAFCGRIYSCDRYLSPHISNEQSWMEPSITYPFEDCPYFIDIHDTPNFDK